MGVTGDSAVDLASGIRRRMSERRAEFAAADGEGECPHPAVKGLAQFVHREFLDTQQHQGIRATGNVPHPYRPARNLMLTRIAAPREYAERPLYQGVSEMHQQRVAARQEYSQAAEPLHEWLGAEGELRHGAQFAARHWAAHGVINNVAPAPKAGIDYTVEPPLFGDLELWPATRNGHCRFQGVAKRVRVEIDLCGHGVQERRFARGVVIHGERGIGFERYTSLHRVETRVQIRLHDCGVFPANQPALHGSIEYLVDRAEVLANPVRLANHMIEKTQVGIRVAGKVVHRHIPCLTVAVEAAVSLLQPGRVPGAVVVQ